MPATGPLLVARASVAETPLGIAVDQPPPRAWPDLTFSNRSAERRRIIAGIVEHHVVPRLAATNGPGFLQAGIQNPLFCTATNTAPSLLQSSEVEELSALVLIGDPSRALALAESARGRSDSIQTLYLNLLAPTARHLGHLWDEDELDFASVTMGLNRLHDILRAFGRPAHLAADAGARKRRALLVAPHGAQHTFGLAMVQNLFRHAAWKVWSGAPADDTELGIIVRQNWFGVIGFSVGCADHLDAVRASIGKVRRASQNRRIGIMVGGPAFVAHPEYATQVGADAMAGDGAEAITRAENLLLVASPLV